MSTRCATGRCTPAARPAAAVRRRSVQRLPDAASACRRWVCAQRESGGQVRDCARARVTHRRAAILRLRQPGPNAAPMAGRAGRLPGDLPLLQGHCGNAFSGCGCRARGGRPAQDLLVRGPGAHQQRPGARTPAGSLPGGVWNRVWRGPPAAVRPSVWYSAVRESVCGYAKHAGMVVRVLRLQAVRVLRLWACGACRVGCLLMLMPAEALRQPRRQAGFQRKQPGVQPTLGRRARVTAVRGVQALCFKARRTAPHAGQASSACRAAELGGRRAAAR